MNYFYEPVNIKQWNMFKKVKGIGHIEPFLATKNMSIGDSLVLNVGKQDRNVESGVYAIANIISEPYILRNHPEDYCNNKLTIDAQITQIEYKAPIINNEVCKMIFTQFRTVHQITGEELGILLKYINSKVLYPDEIPLNQCLNEGAKRRVVVNAYERNSKARQECINNKGNSCIICGFNFEQVYGTEFEGLIHIHHLKQLSEIGTEYVVNPIKDLVPICPNCHMALHSKKGNTYSVEELTNRVNINRGSKL